MGKRILSISYLAVYNRKETPFIRLQGRWLEKLGFEIGKKVIVEESQGKLVLKVEEVQVKH